MFGKERASSGRGRRGSVLVVVVLFLPVLIAFTIAAVDVGWFYSQKSRLQSVADMAVLTALGNVDWVDKGPTTERDQMTPLIQGVLTTNGLASDTFGDPVYTTDDAGDNVVRVELSGRVNVRTFFYNFVRPGATTIPIQVKAAAEVEYGEGPPQAAPNFGLYCREKAYMQSTANNVNSYHGSTWDIHTGMPPQALWDHDLQIGSGEEIHFNGSGNYDADFWSHDIVTSAGSSVVIDHDVHLPDAADCEVSIVEADGVTPRDPIEERVPVVDMPIPPAPALPDTPEAATTCDLSGYPGGDVTIGNGKTLVLMKGKKYLFNDLTMKNNATLEIIDDPLDASAPPAEIYTTGDLVGKGHFTNAERALKVFGIGDETQQISFTGLSAMYADVYAPNAYVTVHGSAGMYGRIYCREGDIQSEFFYDNELPGLGLNWPGYYVVLSRAHLVNQ